MPKWPRFSVVWCRSMREQPHEGKGETMRALKRIVAAAAVIAACTVAAAAADTPLAPVRLDSGLVAGTTRDGINRYFGIPYAAPPVGTLRWQAPQSVNPWTGVRKADAFGPVCRQTVDWIKEPQSEDCLSLNIWAPAKPGKYPVMVWIHGGGFRGGSGSQMGPHAGNGIVAHDVILVSINYRLGLLGFFAHPGLSAESPDKGSGNQGILDQIAALKWVQKNIAAFGGDPNNVTIFGESAGGSAVALLTMSPKAKGLFHRAIAESGTADGLEPKDVAEKRGADFAKAQGAATLADLRNKDVERLIRQPWQNFVNNDGTALPADMAAVYQSGAYNRVPMMTGWNAEEGVDLATEMLGSKTITTAVYNAAVERFVGPKLAPQIRQIYPGNTDAEAKVSAERLVTDIMGFSAFRWSGLHAARKTEPVYSYFFVHWPAEPVTPCGYGCKAGHGAEIKFAFDQLALDPRPWTADDKAIAARMVGYWTNFAKTGDPNGGGLPVWKPFDGTPATVEVLGTESEIKARGSFPDFRAYLALVAQ
jgi:para-nitrobenzyl esterase